MPGDQPGPSPIFPKIGERLFELRGGDELETATRVLLYLLGDEVTPADGHKCKALIEVMQALNLVRQKNASMLAPQKFLRGFVCFFCLCRIKWRYIILLIPVTVCVLTGPVARSFSGWESALILLRHSSS